ncbi:MAG TPA: hypothetical protein ENN89_05050 [Synergistetes bacterium]|nr:hypothetical protein [Synergistota bacterium]
MRRFSLLFAVVSMFCLSFFSVMPSMADETPPVSTALSFGEPETVTVKDDTLMASINWTGDYIEATGQGLPPTGKENTPQGKLLARRAATVDLQRKLLEFVQGVRVDSRTTMTDYMVSDRVRTEVQGVIRRVEILEGSWDGEVYTVVGRVKLQDVRIAVVPELPEKPVAKQVPPPPAPTTPSTPKGRYTGLVIDVSHLPLIPAMTFNVTDTSGKAVYGLSFVDKERFLSSGLCSYHMTVGYAKIEPRVTDAPLVIKAVKLVGPQNVDIVISSADAARIKNSTYDFRIPCRVIVVKR